MPVQKSKSGIFAKYAKTIREHSHDPIRGGLSDLPPNIRNGVAQLEKLYIDKYKSGKNTGEPYLRGEATILEPTSARDGDRMVPVYGLKTVLGPLAINDTEGSEEGDNVKRVIEEIRKLGVSPEEIDAAAEEDEGIENLINALAESDPPITIRFSTAPKYAQDDVKKEGPPTGSWQNWNGVIKDYEPQPADAVQDDTAKKPAASNGKAPAAVAGKKPAVKEPEPELTDEEPDLDALAEVADDDSHDNQADAQKQLTDLALEVGLTKKWVEDIAKNFTQIAERIKEKQAEAGDEVGSDNDKAADEPKEPEEGDVVAYKGAKDKKARDYEVKKVDAKKKTVDLLQIDDGKTKYAAVKWVDVTPSE